MHGLTSPKLDGTAMLYMVSEIVVSIPTFEDD